MGGIEPEPAPGKASERAGAAELRERPVDRGDVQSTAPRDRHDEAFAALDPPCHGPELARVAADEATRLDGGDERRVARTRAEKLA